MVMTDSSMIPNHIKRVDRQDFVSYCWKKVNQSKSKNQKSKNQALEQNAENLQYVRCQVVRLK